MFVAKYFNEFIIFSCIGWLYECTYCTFKDHKWQNRGFLFGPVCPIYGVGALLCVIVFGRISGKLGFPYQTLGNWKIFFVCMVGSAIIELVTSIVLERFFHAAWWDYTDMPLNFQGRICLPASIGFGLAGVVIVRYILPIVIHAEAATHPILNEVMSLIFMAVFAADTVLTVSGLTDLLKKVEGVEENVNVRMQSAYETLEQGLSDNQLTEKAREYVSNLNFRQLNSLRNIKFKSPKSLRMGNRMTNMVLNAKEFEKIKEIKNLGKRKK